MKSLLICAVVKQKIYYREGPNVIQPSVIHNIIQPDYYTNVVIEKYVIYFYCQNECVL